MQWKRKLDFELELPSLFLDVYLEILQLVFTTLEQFHYNPTSLAGLGIQNLKGLHKNDINQTGWVSVSLLGRVARVLLSFLCLKCLGYSRCSPDRHSHSAGCCCTPL